MALSRPFKEDRLPLPLSTPLSFGDWWCGGLCFVTAGSVSSFSTFQIFRETSHLSGLLCLPVYLLGHFPSLWKWMSSTGTFQFLVSHSNFCSKTSDSICEDDGMCGPTVTSWGNPAEDIGDCFHLHCQAGGWDRIRLHCLHVWRLHFAWQWCPTLTGLWWLSHQCTPPPPPPPIGFPPLNPNPN